MSATQDATDLTTNTQRRLVEAVEEAQDALDGWGMQRQRVAVGRNHHPDSDPDVYRAKVEMHARMTRAFRLLRPQIKEHLPYYWIRVEVYDERNDPESDGDRVIRGLKALEGFQERIVEKQRTVKNRQKRDSVERVFDVELLPGAAYRRVINLFGECMEHLGYVSPPHTPEKLGVAGGDGAGSGEDIVREQLEEQLEEIKQKEDSINVE